MSKLQEAVQRILAEQANGSAPKAADLYEQVNNKEDNNVTTEDPAPESADTTGNQSPDIDTAELTDPAAKELASATQPDDDDVPTESIDFGDNDDTGLDESSGTDEDSAGDDGEGSEVSDTEESNLPDGSGDGEGTDDSSDTPNEGSDPEGGDEDSTPSEDDDSKESDEGGEEVPDEETNPEEGSGEETPEESSGEETPEESDSEEEAESEDPEFDEEGNLKTLEAVEDAADGKDDVSHAASVVSEAKELSDRLGDLARELIEREGIEDASTEALRRVIKISVESIQDRAELLVGDTVNVIDGEDPYLVAIQKAITKARDSLRQARELSQNLAIHAISERAQAIRSQVDSLEGGAKDITLAPKVAKNLSVNGEINLDAYSYATSVQTIAKEVTDWLRGNVGPYLISASKGESPSFAPLASSLVKANPAIAQGLKDTGAELASDEISPRLPGDCVFAYLQTVGYPPLLSLVKLPAQTELPTVVTLGEISKPTLDRLLAQMNAHGTTAVKMASIINQMFEVLSQVENWAVQTWDEDRDAVTSLRVEHLATAVTLPVLDVFYLAYKQYVAINELFTSIEEGQA